MLHLQEPLHGKFRFDGHVGTFGETYLVGIGFHFLQQTGSSQVLLNLLAHIETVHTDIQAGSFTKRSVIIEDVNARQIVLLTQHVVVHIVGRSYLQTTGTELYIYVIVLDTVSYAEVANYVESGDLKVLAVMNDKRLDSIPDVPTCQEAGYDVVLGTWRGLGVPKDTPDEVVDQLYEIFSQAAQSDAFVDFMNKSNNVIDVLDGATFEERIKSDLETYTALVTDLGLKVQ